MSLKISWKYLIAFIALNMIMGELHEQAHIQMGYLVCGCYGPRDFNVWTTCETCAHPSLAYWATIMGPAFSYLVYWFSALFLLKQANTRRNKLGIALLFATLPFARIFTACMGGGDEKTVLVMLWGEQFSLPLLKVMAAAWVILFCLPPLWMAIKSLPQKNRWWYAAGFCIGPLLFGVFWQRWVLKSALSMEWWKDTYIAGTPLLVILHFLLMLVLLIRFRKALTE